MRSAIAISFSDNLIIRFYASSEFCQEKLRARSGQGFIQTV
jgi:hypothetical protein